MVLSQMDNLQQQQQNECCLNHVSVLVWRGRREMLFSTQITWHINNNSDLIEDCNHCTPNCLAEDHLSIGREN